VRNQKRKQGGSIMWGFAEDNDRTFGALDDFRRRMDRLFEGFDARWGVNDAYGAGFPRAELRDTGAELVLEADVPGLTDKDIQLTVTQDTLGLSGERKSDAPEGYSVHRRERGAQRFSRAWALPTRIDTERVEATVKNGVLTITMPKAADARPRSITVKASS
jgi:HSP20 family protein